MTPSVNPPVSPRAEICAALGWKHEPATLPDSFIERVREKPPGKRIAVSDGSTPGLVWRVSPDGAHLAAWLFYRVRGSGLRRTMRIDVPLVGADGKPSLKPARRLADEYVEAVKLGRDPFAEVEAAQAKAEQERASTLRAYLAAVYAPEVFAHHARPKAAADGIRHAWESLLDKPLAAISDTDIERVLAARKKDGMAAGTLLRDYHSLGGLLNHARKRKHTVAATLEDFPPALLGEKPTSRVRYLGLLDPGEPARFEAALAAVPERTQVIIRIAWGTGMRRGEVLSLEKTQIRADHVFLPGAKQKNGRDGIVHIGPKVRAVLDAWTVRGMKGELFPAESMLALERAVERDWARLMEAAKITDFHFHDLRHDFAVRMLRAGAPLAQVRDQLRHSSISMTERYAHTVPSDTRTSVERVG